MKAPEGSEGESVRYPQDSPSILAAPYAAVMSASTAVVGSTKADVADAAEALAQLSPHNVGAPADEEATEPAAASAAAAVELKEGAERVWEPFSAWRACTVRVCAGACAHTFGMVWKLKAWHHTVHLTQPMITMTTMMFALYRGMVRFRNTCTVVGPLGWKNSTVHVVQDSVL